MVDQESQDVVAEGAGGAQQPTSAAPVNRDKPSVPDVSQGEVAARDDGESTSPAGKAADAAAPAQVSQAASSGRSRPGAFGAFLSGALGGLIVAAIAGGAGYYFFAPKADLAEAEAGRLAAIELQVQHEDAAVAGIDKRVAALEGSSSSAALAEIDKRLGALQAANADETPRITAATQAVQTLTGQVKDLQTLAGEVKNLRADVDAARGEIPALSARVAKLESGPPQAVAADLSAVTARLDKIETQLAAPKPAASENSAAVAIVAASLRDKLVRGAPFSTEIEGLERLGVEPAKLAPLKVVADGAPTDGALAAAFEAVRPKILAAAVKTEKGGGIVDRFVARLHGLIQVRDLNETAGDDPQAVTSRIEADCRRGDVSGALAAFAKLPEASRQAASAWAAAAESRQAADKAIQSIRETAVAQLAEGGKP